MSRSSPTGVPGYDATASRPGTSRSGGSTRSAANPPDAVPPVDERPQRADGIELLGELKDSGYHAPPSLVRRPGGQTVQLTTLLYLVLKAIDGQRTFTEIADAVSAEYGRRLTAEDVHGLTASQLRPLGLVCGADGSEPAVARSNPLLALRFRWVVSDPQVTRRITAPFATLFTPVVVVTVLVTFVLISGWLLFTKGLASATYQAFDQPLLLLVVFAITVLSAGFHEFGHAAACRYGGVTPGAMGTGLYLVWPAFYTDVSDSYRLSRGGRLRVDLGGLYFNAIVSVAMYVIWAGTGWDAILLIQAAQLLQMVRQLAPMVRFDGYHVLADLTGVPDLYSRLGPILLSLCPGRRPDPRVAALRPGPRIVVTTWVLLIVPLLAFTVLMMVLALPRVLGTAWGSLNRQADALSIDWAGGDLGGVGVRVLAIVAIGLPVLGSLLLLARLVRTTGTAVWQRTKGHPARRAVAVVTAGGLVAALIWTWWPDANRYRPIQPFERGTVTQALASAGLSSASTGALEDGQIVQARSSVWASASTPPTAEHPELALVLIPREQQTDTGPLPTWVFPFNRPAAPGPGDNQALAVNTKDGSTLYDVAFALVWADGKNVTNANEAYAFASCRQCTTVAVAFQVILMTGSAHVVIPQNVAGAVNYSCMQCLTYALAQQLVLTVPTELTPETRQRLDALWGQISVFAATIQGLPLDQIRERLLNFQGQVRELIVGAGGATPTPSMPAPSATTSAAPAPVSSSGPVSPSTTTSPSTQAVTGPVPSTTVEVSSPGTTDATPAQSSTAPATSAPPTTSTLDAP